MEKTSQISGFYKLTPKERAKFVKDFAGLTDQEVELLQSTGSLPLDLANRMIENVIGAIPVPLGIATNFRINGVDRLIPMAIEEPSVVAAASNAAKMARAKGGFWTSSTGPIMMSQIQLVGVPDPNRAKMQILENKQRILDLANQQDPMLVKAGGGARDVTVRVIDTQSGPMVITHLHVDCRDAMGANAVNTMAEKTAPLIEQITGGKVYLRILTNLADQRISRARAIFAKEALGGPEAVEGVLQAYAFAVADTYRATTHNKGIQNAIVAIALATGNDTRALESGAHSYAARSGRYGPLSTWERDANGDLIGTLEMPMAVGLIGGATRTHPIAQIAVKILGVKTAQELAEVMAAVGLAQNLAALLALATVGIQQGHLGLHSRNVAASVGAVGDEIDIIAAKMVEEKRVRMDRAKELLDELRKKKT